MRLVRDAVITPERVTALLAERHPGVQVESVDVLDESEGSASRLRLAVRAAGVANELPSTLFLKRNLADFTFPPEMYLTECRFYRDLAPALEIETPTVYGMEVDESTGAFALLMEDLGGRGARLGIVTDPTTPDEVASVLVTLAGLHAPFWDSTRLDRDLTWLQAPTTSPFVSFWRERGPRLARRHLERGHRGAVVAEHPWVHDRVWTAFDALQPRLAERPRAVVHGDVHVGNTYFIPGGPGGVLDWQLMLQGSWSVDVAYLLMTALAPDARADHERDLLRFYLAELSARGVQPPTEPDAWLLYRQNAVWGVVMWLVTPEGVHSDAVQATSLARCIAAAEDLDSLEALEA
jgi:aminoglycoside phosphotransferase (APT) family kinase protein